MNHSCEIIRSINRRTIVTFDLRNYSKNQTSMYLIRMVIYKNIFVAETPKNAQNDKFSAISFGKIICQDRLQPLSPSLFPVFKPNYFDKLL